MSAPVVRIRPSCEVVLLTDDRGLTSSVHDALAEAFSVSQHRLADVDALPALTDQAVVFCLASLDETALEVVHAVMGGMASKPLFFFSHDDPESRAQVAALGAQSFVAPLNCPAIFSGVRHALNECVEASWRALEPAEETALRASKQGFEDCFATAARGERLPVQEVFSACEKIKESIGVSNVDRWLGALRRHHDNTYRHSMFVCGSLAFFAHARGLRGDELKQLTMAGFLHDAGKACIPLAILDKPGKLDDIETQIMRTHPEHSREILLRESGLSRDIVEMAVHHHEKLDGTGYPDGLKGAELSDLVRLTAIADVYSALTEERAYKPALPPERALNMMKEFGPCHLDQVLVKAFREFALDHIGVEAA